MTVEAVSARRAWAMVAIVFVTVGFAGGTWHMFGIFVKPMEAAFQASRTALSLVVSLSQFTYFLLMLVMGRVLDRFGPRAVIVTGVAIMGVGALLSSRVQSVGQMHLTFGVVLALGYAMCTINVSSVAVTQWFARRRGTAMGVALAGFNAGQLILLPLTQYWILAYGWREAFVALGLLTLVLPLPLAWAFLRNGPHRISGRPGAGCHTGVGGPRSARGLTAGALRSRSFWFLSFSFFGCGFSDFVLAAHLPPFAVDVGISPWLSGAAHGFISGLSIPGVILLGVLSDRLGRRLPLTFIYLVRAGGFAFLPWVRDVPGLAAFIVAYGFFYFASTPMTSAAAADIFGPERLGTLYGYIVAAHGLGALAGPYVAGALFDATGSYQAAFWTTGGLLLAAALCCALIEDPVGEAHRRRRRSA
ncbi:MAG: MFS transporter [Candidatus Tectomicrobia bacterium]|nr:MFS transporter [Candidatus Tectomicrobia bacterium]